MGPWHTAVPENVGRLPQQVKRGWGWLLAERLLEDVPAGGQLGFCLGALARLQVKLDQVSVPALVGGVEWGGAARW